MAFAISNDFDLKCGNSKAGEKELGFANLTPMIGRKRIVVSHCTESSPPMIGRKRIVVSHCTESSPLSSTPTTPPRKRLATMVTAEWLHLEALPQDILVHILCYVDHDDLKQLIQVSKSIREAALIAEKLHFDFSTPGSKTARLTPFSDLNDDQFDPKTPNAPLQLWAFQSPFSRKNLAVIGAPLFA